jgi:HEAT repeat protein
MPDTAKIANLIEKLRRPGRSSGSDSFQRREEAMNELVSLGPDAVPHLIPLLEEDDAALREHVVRALGYIGDRSALPALLRAVEDPYARGASIRAMESMGEAALPYLISFAASYDDSISAPALAVLTMLGERAVPGLKEVLRDGNAEPRARQAAGKAMSIIRKDKKCPFGGSRTMGVDCRYCKRKHKD